MKMKDSFKTIQKIFSDLFNFILNNKYFMVFFLTSVLITIVGMFVIVLILAFKIPIILAILIFVIIYLTILSDLNEEVKDNE